MVLPPLLILPDEAAYESYWIVNYVTPGSLTTFDGIEVRFFRRNFEHAFFSEAVRGSGKKDRFDLVRAKRMNWISALLCGSAAEIYRRLMPNRKLRRIALDTSEDYAVVIEVERNGKRGQFVTAYVVNSAVALGKMRNNPRW
jgi:hypothetical protein